MRFDDLELNDGNKVGYRSHLEMKMGKDSPPLRSLVLPLVREA